jgi:hypothetical protein
MAAQLSENIVHLYLNGRRQLICLLNFSNSKTDSFYVNQYFNYIVETTSA